MSSKNASKVLFCMTQLIRQTGPERKRIFCGQPVIQIAKSPHFWHIKAR
jgi:hypothetical protein